jgi:hypothetical protein
MPVSLVLLIALQLATASNTHIFPIRCSICLADIAKHEMLQKTKCNHVFHKQCIIPWVERESNCPNCRQKHGLIINKSGELMDENQAELSARRRFWKLMLIYFIPWGIAEARALSMEFGVIVIYKSPAQMSLFASLLSMIIIVFVSRCSYGETYKFLMQNFIRLVGVPFTFLLLGLFLLTGLEMKNME